MPAARKRGARDSTTRSRLLDAAERLMLEQGYAAVTSRKLADTAGVKSPLIHYYFASMDELFLEVYRRRAEQGIADRADALTTERPLHLLWETGTDPSAAGFFIEMAALANHRKAVRGELARYAERFREMHMDAVTRVLERKGLTDVPPAVVLLAMMGLSVLVGLERQLGITRDHDEAEAFIQAYLDRLEGEEAPPG